MKPLAIHGGVAATIWFVCADPGGRARLRSTSSGYQNHGAMICVQYQTGI